MADLRLNRAERVLQHSFMKSSVFNGLLMLTAVAGCYLWIRALPARRALPAVSVGLTYTPVELAEVAEPLRLAGAWEVEVVDSRFGGISSLAIDHGRFLAVSDRGSVTSVRSTRYAKSPSVGRGSSRGSGSGARSGRAMRNRSPPIRMGAAGGSAMSRITAVAL